MSSATDSIVQSIDGAAPLLNSVSRTTLAALSFSFALGVALPHEASAGSGAVSPVQTSTYILGAHNPITFGIGTKISAASYVGVYGGFAETWTIANYGAIQGPLQGIHLNSSGSTVTNSGTIAGIGAKSMGVLLPNGGAVTNLSSGSISGYVGVYIGGAGGTVTNAGSIAGTLPAVLVVSGSIDNELGGTLSMSGNSFMAAYAGKGGSVTNAGTITELGQRRRGRRRRGQRHSHEFRDDLGHEHS